MRQHQSILCTLLILVTIQPLTAQSGISLPALYRAADSMMALDEQKQFIGLLGQTGDALAGTAWQPRITLNAQATYQSDVVGLPIESPLFEVPQVPKDQYRITLDVSQTLFDGGAVGMQKERNDLQTAAGLAELEAGQYPLYHTINQLYGAILYNDLQEEQLLAGMETLREVEASLKASLEQGVITMADYDLIGADILELEQQLIAVRYERDAALVSLKTLTGIPLDESTEFIKPALIEQASTDLNRPELMALDRQIIYEETMVSQLGSFDLPSLQVFAQGGYGNPGLNLLLNEFDTWYIAGLRLQYPLWKGGQDQKEAEIHQIRSMHLARQKENMAQQFNASAQAQQKSILKLEAMLERDAGIVAAKEKRLEATRTALSEGTATTVDLSRDAAAFREARIRTSLHEVQLLLARIDLQFITGNINQ